MGMFDYITYNGNQYQSKDTPRQACDNYKIEADQETGQLYLWVEDYDSEWVDDPGMMFGGHLRQFNERWILCHDFDGTIDFYRNLDKTYKKWEEYHSLFMDGRLLKIELKEVDYE
jgi:hypothetical protein